MVRPRPAHADRAAPSRQEWNANSRPRRAPADRALDDGVASSRIVMLADDTSDAAAGSDVADAAAADHATIRGLVSERPRHRAP